MSDYIDSYYARTRLPSPRRPAVSGTVGVDVAIVGGGLAGLTAGIELVRAGRTVAVLEAERIGWGASGRNGGFVGPGYATSLSHIGLLAGRDSAKELYRLSIEGVRIVEENLTALGMTDNVATYGKLSVMRYADPSALKARQEQMARDFGYALEFRDREQVRGMLRSTKYHEALFDPRAFHIHPLNYALGLAAGIEALDGQVFEGSPVTGSDLDGATKVLHTSSGRI